MENVNDTEYYLRLNLLNVEGGTPVVQSVIQKIVASTYADDIDRFLKYFKDELELLEQSGTIAGKMFTVLYPSDGTATDLEKWDVSLATSVLVNCCTLERKQKRLQRMLQKEIKKNGNNKLPAYISKNKNTLDKWEGNLITKEINEGIQKAQSINELSTRSMVCIVLICGSNETKKELYSICEKIFLQEIELDLNDKTSQGIYSYMNTKKEKITSMKKDLAIFEKEFNQLYPSDGQCNYASWSINLLVLFVINVCERLTHNSQVALKRIRQLRNEMVAHKGKAELKFGDFLPAWTDLFNAITTLLKEEGMGEKEFENRVKHFKEGDLNIQSAIDTLKKHVLEESNEYQVLKETFGDIEGKVLEKIEEYEDDKKQLMESTYTKIKDVANVLDTFVKKRTVVVYNNNMEITCVDIKIMVKGNDSRAVEKAHEAIRAAIEDTTGEERKKRKAVDKILQILERDGSTVVEVRKGSVIAKVRFTNLKGVATLLIYIDSEDWTDNLEDLTTDLGEELGQTFTIEAKIPEESLQSLHDDIQQKDNEVEIKVPLMFGRSLKMEEANTKEELPNPHMETTFRIAMTSDKHPSQVRACTVLHSGEIIICDGKNKNIKLFDNNYNACLDPLQLHNFPNDSCLSTQNQNEVVITVPKEKTLLFVRVENFALQYTNIINVEEECFGICCWPNGIATTVAHPASKKWHVQLLDWHGTHIRTLNVSLPSRLTPSFVSLYSNNDGKTIIISDYGTSRVIAINTIKGNVEYVCKDKYLYRVTNVTACDEGLIFAVGCLSDSVHVISTKGKVLGQVLSHIKNGLCCPSGLEYHRSSRTLYLQPDHSKSEMKVYKCD